MPDNTLMVFVLPEAKCTGILVRAPKLLQRECLIDTIDQQILMNGGDPENVNPYVLLEMPCGEKMEFTRNNIPDIDIPCPCGNPDHSMIKYETTTTENETHP